MTTKQHQALMIGNGALIILVGLLCGFGLLFNLLGEITLWPFPGSLDIQVPGDTKRWIAAHVGNILNAIMIIVVALCLPHLAFTEKTEKWVAWGMVLVVWGNAGFYLLSALGASGRGLSFSENRFGGGDLMSQVAFLIAYPGAGIAVVIMAMIAIRSFASLKKGGD